MSRPAAGLHRELAPGYRIARVINGCWQLSAGHRSEPADREQVLDGWIRLAEAGFTTFDGADIYTGVEELLGELLRRWRRGGRDADALQLHTKYVPDQDALPRLTRGDVEAAVDRSLRRLEVERLDLVQLAWWDYAVPGCVDVAGWLDDLRRKGKIRHLGATNFDVPSLTRILDAGVPLVAHQVQYSLLDRRPEHAMAELCRRRGVGLLSYGSLAGGFLGDPWVGAREPRSPLGDRSLVKYRLIVDELGGWALFQELLAVLAAVARRHGVTVANVAARWTLDRPGVTAVILGARSDAHLEENLALLDLRLDAEDHQRLAAVLDRARGPRGDTFELERDPQGPHAGILRKNLNREGGASG